MYDIKDILFHFRWKHGHLKVTNFLMLLYFEFYFRLKQYKFFLYVLSYVPYWLQSCYTFVIPYVFQYHRISKQISHYVIHYTFIIIYVYNSIRKTKF